MVTKMNNEIEKVEFDVKEIELCPEDGSILDAAVRLSKRRWKIHPLIAGGKRPITKWTDDASFDEGIISDWCADNARYNYGIVTGKDSCVVLDVDVKNNAGGMQSLMDIFHKEEIHSMPIVLTPSGGIHIYFQSDTAISNKQNFMPGLDFRGDGGYIVGPGSAIDGIRYRPSQGFYDKELPSIPKKLIDAMNSASCKASAKRKIKASMLNAEGIAIGGRNEKLFQVSRNLRNKGMTEAKALECLINLNDMSCNPPLDKKEVESIVRSCFSKGRSMMAYVDQFDDTEKGYSEMFLDLSEERMIYSPEYKSHLFWDGKLWSFDGELMVERQAKFVSDRYKGAMIEAEEAADDYKRQGNTDASKALDTKRKGYLKAMSRTGSRSGVKNLIELARSEIVITQDLLDQNDMLFAVENGVIDLADGMFTDAPSMNNYMTMSGRVRYEEGATCDAWLQFLDQCTSGDVELKAYLQRIAGYCLSGSTSEQVFFFLYGFGANGKSTFINILQRLLGSYKQSLPSSALMVQKSGSSGASPEIAMLRGKRLAVASELEEGERLHESLIKMLTGGDAVPARHLYREYFEFTPKFKLFMVGNHKPHVSGGDHGIWRRIRLIPFSNIIPQAERDPNLEKKLVAELSGILNWAIEGCLAWHERGLDTPRVVCKQTEDYRESEDILMRFIADSCEKASGAGVLQKNLYDGYKDWARDNNEWAMTNRAFGNKLDEHGFVKTKRAQGNYRQGLRLNNGGVPFSYPGGFAGRVEGETDDDRGYTI